MDSQSSPSKKHRTGLSEIGTLVREMGRGAGREGCFASYDELVKKMYKPTDPSSLGVIRFLFGLLMLVDLPEERGGADIDLRWGEPRDCHFPLFSFLQVLPFQYMALLYGIMWLGAFGIMLGYQFQLSTFLFGVPYWYILLLDKSFWNNHSYLYGIVIILLSGSSANHFFSVDGMLDKRKKNAHVPYWNYFILKYQFFMLYFLAGLKKTDHEWLDGYGMTDLGSHWVFSPFRLFLDAPQIDHLIVHWFGFLLDLTIGFWMLYELTRPVAMVFCASFHLMNSRLFSIGMFPYVCLATMPLFCEENWPRKLCALLFAKGDSEEADVDIRASDACIYSEQYHDRQISKNHGGGGGDGGNDDLRFELPKVIAWRHRLVVALLLGHCGLQAFLPYSHSITKGYNNWTNGLYGYSWDMMVHSWDTVLVMVKVVDNDSGAEHFLDPDAWTQTERWSKHADMCLQYAQCVKRNLLQDGNNGELVLSDNLSVYVDVWCSLNGRFQQRMYDPNYDLLRAQWSPFRPVEWLKPVLSQYSGSRTRMREISEDVYLWSNYSDVLFVADFPGLHLENFIPDDLRNVTLTILEGHVIYETDGGDKSHGMELQKGDRIAIETGMFHKIHTVGSIPSCYMYTYVNGTREMLREEDSSDKPPASRDVMYSPFPLIEDVSSRLAAFLRMWGHITGSLSHVAFGKPLPNIRTRIPPVVQ